MNDHTPRRTTCIGCNSWHGGPTAEILCLRNRVQELNQILITKQIELDKLNKVDSEEFDKFKILRSEVQALKPFKPY